MKLTRAAAAVVFAAAAGLGLATPALADPHVIPLPNLDPRPLGTFSFEAEDGEKAEWTITPCADVEDAHHSMNLCHLANISFRVGNRKLRWDGANERFVDDEQANRLLKANYRQPWVVPEKV